MRCPIMPAAQRQYGGLRRDLRRSAVGLRNLGRERAIGAVGKAPDRGMRNEFATGAVCEGSRQDGSELLEILPNGAKRRKSAPHPFDLVCCGVADEWFECLARRAGVEKFQIGAAERI